MPKLELAIQSPVERFPTVLVGAGLSIRLLQDLQNVKRERQINGVKTSIQSSRQHARKYPPIPIRNAIPRLLTPNPNLSNAKGCPPYYDSTEKPQ